ncbi:MAG: inositol monophosphatase family protein [Candidatus Methylumidiphilus sp.]
MDPMLTMAVRAARAAGDLIMRSADRIDTLTITAKGRNDFVSEVDRQAEQEIVSILSRAYPSHAFLGEEGGRHGLPKGEFTWVIDPLDGTTNFLHGFPQFAVSIALLHKGGVDCGVVYDPVRQELFTAKRGGGATLNDRRLRVTPQKNLLGALLGTGFPFKDQRHNDAYFGMFRELMKDAAGIRRPGSAALDLAWVACGRMDGFWEIGLMPWDIAAGVLLVMEAGGIVTDFDGGAKYFETGNVLTANPKLHAQMAAAIRPHVTDALRYRPLLDGKVGEGE